MRQFRIKGRVNNTPRRCTQKELPGWGQAVKCLLCKPENPCKKAALGSVHLPTLEWVREVNAGSLQASPYDQIDELQLQWDTLPQKIKWTGLWFLAPTLRISQSYNSRSRGSSTLFWPL